MLKTKLLYDEKNVGLLITYYDYLLILILVLLFWDLRMIKAIHIL